MDKHQALELILRQLGQGELIFPTNMAASVRLLKALDDPDCHLATAAEMVVAEPLVAARLVAIANSVAYTRFGGRVNNVPAAVSMLGFKPLRSLVAAIVVRQFTQEIGSSAAKEYAERLWAHSARVAALAKVMARELGMADPETALFAGVVHELDGFYLLYRAKDYPVLLECVRAWDVSERAALLHAVLQALKLPRLVATAVEGVLAEKPMLFPFSCGDVLRLADSLAETSSPFSDAASASDVSGYFIEGKSLRAVLNESREEVDALTEVLLV